MRTNRPFDIDALARLPLSWVHREFPNQVSLSMNSAADARTPRQMTPAFYGCYDWHSAVHGHWTLARIARLYPSCESAAEARAALEHTLTREHIEGELAYVGPRSGFERPYGVGWLLTLALELHEWNEPEALRWAEVLSPLTDLAAERLAAYFEKLTHPVRSGEHSQTAFALGLAIDWARGVGALDHAARYEKEARRFHEQDRDAPLHREPSGADFLSPALAEADVMRRILVPDAFARWLDMFLSVPHDGSRAWLHPVTTRDRADGRLAHLDGLSLSRAWMLEGIACGLPDGDARRPALFAAADEHAAAGMTALESGTEALTHWIGSFAAYMLTGRGLPEACVRVP